MPGAPTTGSSAVDVLRAAALQLIDECLDGSKTLTNEGWQTPLTLSALLQRTADQAKATESEQKRVHDEERKKAEAEAKALAKEAEAEARAAAKEAERLRAQVQREAMKSVALREAERTVEEQRQRKEENKVEAAKRAAEKEAEAVKRAAEKKEAEAKKRAEKKADKEAEEAKRAAKEEAEREAAMYRQISAELGAGDSSASNISSKRLQRSQNRTSGIFGLGRRAKAETGQADGVIVDEDDESAVEAAVLVRENKEEMVRRKAEFEKVERELKEKRRREAREADLSRFNVMMKGRGKEAIGYDDWFDFLNLCIEPMSRALGDDVDPDQYCECWEEWIINNDYLGK